MLQYTIRRLLLIIPTMFFVALITFTLAHMAPGSPFDKNENRPMSQETIDRTDTYLRTAQPVPSLRRLITENRDNVARARSSCGKALSRSR